MQIWTIFLLLYNRGNFSTVNSSTGEVIFFFGRTVTFSWQWQWHHYVFNDFKWIYIEAIKSWQYLWSLTEHHGCVKVEEEVFSVSQIKDLSSFKLSCHTFSSHQSSPFLCNKVGGRKLGFDFISTTFLHCMLMSTWLGG